MPYAPDDQRIQAALQPFYLAAVGAEEGWYDLTGRDIADAPGRLEFTLSTHARILEMAEIPGYVAGMAAHYQATDLLLDTVPADVIPTMLSVDEYAAAFRKPRPSTAPPDVTDGGPLSRDGVISRIHRWESTVVYLVRRERALFAAEAAALSPHATADDVQAWERIRRDWGLARLTRLEPPTTTQLAIPTGEPETMRRIRALMIGTRERWFRYLEPDETDTGLIFNVEINGEQVTIPAANVHPWVLGVADTRGPTAANLVTYREGL